MLPLPGARVGSLVGELRSRKLRGVGKKTKEILPHNIPHSQAVSFLINLFIYLFLAALGLHCCARAFSGCSEQGVLFVVMRGLLIAVASLVAEQGL